MKTGGANKVVIKVGCQEQQENAKNSRKTLRVLQESADNKENLTGRTRIDKAVKLAGNKDNDNQDHKRKKLAHKEVQTGNDEAVGITAEDLTSDEPSSEYWRLLAEKRQDALNDSLHENEKLKDHIEALEEENRICKEMLDESKHLIDVLQEMVGETDTSTEIAEEATEAV